jgi:hypothetical protein
MKTVKWILVLILILLVSVISAFLFETVFRILIRKFFDVYNPNINFVGKDWHLFANLEFVAAFGIFSVLLFILLYLTKQKLRLIYFALVIVSFFLTIAVTTYFDGVQKIKESAIDPYGLYVISKSEINYDLHFILALTFGLLPLAILNAKRK